MIGAVLSAIVILGQAAAATPPTGSTPAAATTKRVCHSEPSPDSPYPKQVCTTTTVPTAAPTPTANATGVTVVGKKPLTAQQDANTVVCHDEQVLGSLFPKKVCATKQALEERKRDDQEVARDFQRSVIAGPQPQ